MPGALQPGLIVVPARVFSALQRCCERQSRN